MNHLPALRRLIRPCLAAAVLGLAGLLASCGPQSDSGAAGAKPAAGNVKIGFLVKQPEEPWFQLEWSSPIRPRRPSDSPS